VGHSSVLRKCLECEPTNVSVAHEPADERHVHESACRLLEMQCRASGLREIMSSTRLFGGRPFLFAGAVRDALFASLTGITSRPRDYDIGIARVRRDRFEAFATCLGAEPNQYGGYHLTARDALRVDLWRIEDTVGVLVHACRPTIMNVLRSFVIDLNAVAYDPTEKVLQDHGCLEALCRREIGLVRDALLHDHSNFAGRALALQHRFAFRLSKELREFVAAWYDSAEAERQRAKINAGGYSSGGCTASLQATPGAICSGSDSVCPE